VTLLKKILAGAVAAAFLALGIEIAILRHELAARDRTIEAAVAEKAAALGFAQAQLESEKRLTAKLTAGQKSDLAALKKVDARVKPVEHAHTDVTISGTAPVGDGRFTLSPDCLTVTRNERFSLDLLVVKGVDGKARLAKSEFHELNPVTGIVIPGTQAKLTTSLEYVEEEPAAPPFFHPRALAGVGYLGQVGAGVELLNGERLGGVWAHTNLSLLGLYNTQKHTVQGAAVLGFRPFDWNVSFGPAFFYPSGGLGAAATIELTR
jgi:hypothetical protein